MLDLLFDAWRTDTAAGRTSLMLAADSQTVADLNARARHHRITTGQVSTKREITLADRSTVGVGDLVVTRHNHRNLAVAGSRAGWVKNGDEWTVKAVREDGSLTVRRRAGTGVAVLPPDYVSEHVELGYATTAHRAQGRTVDTAHAYLSAATVRESLYVMATRGRETNKLYVDTTYDPDTQTSHQDPESVLPEDILRSVIATSGADTSAHETRASRRSRPRLPNTTRCPRRRNPCQAAGGARPRTGPRAGNRRHVQRHSNTTCDSLSGHQHPLVPVSGRCGQAPGGAHVGSRRLNGTLFGTSVVRQRLAVGTRLEASGHAEGGSTNPALLSTWLKIRRTSIEGRHRGPPR